MEPQNWERPAREVTSCGRSPHAATIDRLVSRGCGDCEVEGNRPVRRSHVNTTSIRLTVASDRSAGVAIEVRATGPNVWPRRLSPRQAPSKVWLVRIVSLNAWGGAMYDQFAAWLPTAGADVLCLQEVTRTPGVQGWTEFRDADRAPASTRGSVRRRGGAPP